MQIKSNRLGEMLLEAGMIDRFQLDSALSMQRNLGGRIGSALVKLGYLPEETIMEFLESQAKYSRVQLQDLDIPPELMTLISAEKLLHLLVIPIELRKTGAEKILRVAMTDPTNLKLVDDLQFASGCRVLPVLASESEIQQALNKHLPKEQSKAMDHSDEVDEMFKEFQLEVDAGPTKDHRLDKLLNLLKEKGVLSVIDIERIKFD